MSDSCLFMFINMPPEPHWNARQHFSGMHFPYHRLSAAKLINIDESKNFFHENLLIPKEIINFVAIYPCNISINQYKT